MANLLELEARKLETKGKITAKETAIRNIENKITRLEAVKDDIEAIKSRVETEKGKAKYKTFLSGDKKNWKGDKADLFKEAITSDDGVEKSYKQYYSDVDDLLDSLVDKITSLENQKIGEQGFLRGLRSTLNNIIGEIEKFFN